MPSPLLLGIAAALASAVLGAGWQIASRHGVTTTLGPIEVAVLRYAVPALVLLPLWRRHREWARCGWPLLLLVALTGGLPFGLLVLAGAQHAPAAHIAVFTSATIPLFAALLGAAFLGDRLDRTRWWGFAMILTGVGLLAAGSFGAADGAWRGDLLFLLAGVSWAVHTLAFRRSGLGAWDGAALANGVSALLLLALLPFFGANRLFTAPLSDVLLQVIWQTVIAGLLGLATYMAAVRALGGQRAALSAALVPPLTAVGEVVVLGAPARLPVMLAAALAAVGVLVASGALAARGAKVA